MARAKALGQGRTDKAVFMATTIPSLAKSQLNTQLMQMIPVGSALHRSFRSSHFVLDGSRIAAPRFHCAEAPRRLWWPRLMVYVTPVVVDRQLQGDAWCVMQISTPQFRGVLHKPRIGIVPDPFLVKAVWLRETMLHAF